MDAQRNDAKQERGQNATDLKLIQQTLQNYCQPGDSACMKKLAGDGSAQYAGINDTKKTLDEYQAEPVGNAAGAVKKTCGDFQASLPAGDPANNPDVYTAMCKEMTR
ncbi:hypothetical protein [Streptomyces sp. cg36]|uniref:hypothetical protein n=1 Tax=Streptomyces sp. cg36 TaxID=3238798 RepID=UPI0034E2043E